MRIDRCFAVLLTAFLLGGVAPNFSPALAQEATEPAAMVEEGAAEAEGAAETLETATVGDEADAAKFEGPAHLNPAGVDTGSTTWLLVSSALVLLMVPGLALFYGGMCRAKNTLNMFMCCMVAIGVIGLQWLAIGYCLTFAVTPLIQIANPLDPEGAPWTFLGFDPSMLFLAGYFTQETFGRMLASGDTAGAINNGLPELAFFVFQGKFAIITPALIVGAVAERIKFGPWCLFILLWATLVYNPVAHWVWNVTGWAWQWGIMDFAGGTVVHVLGGFSGLALALVIGKRRGYGEQPLLPHSIGLTLIGAGLLWFGWFGFNAGSAVALPGAELPVAGTVAVLAFANTQVAAAAAATMWMIIEWLHQGKPTVLGFASGMVAGLVVITPCAGHLLPWSSMVVGLLGGAICYGGCQLKHVFKYDDSLDAFGVHGIGGAFGAIAVGVFAFRPVAGLIYADDGSGATQVFKQVVGVVVAAVYCFVLTYIIAMIIEKTMGFRASPENEDEGLDVTAHGEQAYRLL